MEQKTPKFRLRLNLFDGIILVLVLLVGGFFIWSQHKPGPAANNPATSASSVRYTIRIQRWREGTDNLIQIGDKITDNVKNFEMGQVVAVEKAPAMTQVLDHINGAFVQTEVEGYDDVLVTLESDASISQEAVQLSSGYTIRVGASAYIRGSGYMGSGSIISIEREGQA